MKAAAKYQQHRPGNERRLSTLLTFVITTLLSTSAAASTQIVLERGSQRDHAAEITGVVDLAIRPGFENAKVTVVVDGQRVADGLGSPYHVVVDFGENAIQHKIAVTARGPKGKRVQWTETINRGMLPLSVKVKPVDLAAGLFEAEVTSPNDDPVEAVQLWDSGHVISTVTAAPYRFTAPDAVLAGGFIQVTAKTKSGEEAADFWSAAGNVHVAELQVRTVSIFVSVVDTHGNTHDNVDRSQFRIMDGESEARIIEFGKAFDQPISIALLIDSSASMLYSLPHATKAAAEFVRHALKDGDRCSVTAIQEVPRRKQSLTGDQSAVAKAVEGITPNGRTALYDSVASAIRELREEKNRRAIVVLSDGSDTASNWSYEELDQLAREAAIPIYFIAYESAGDKSLRDIDRLRFLAAQTGGFVATATQQNLMAKYEAIEKDLRAQFAITYQISDLGRSNEWRPVRVVMSSSQLTARTIKGYFTP